MALRNEVTFASGGTPVGRSQRTPSSAIECTRATGPPRPSNGSKTPPSMRPTRVTKVPAAAPIPPAEGTPWQLAQERPLNSGPSPWIGDRSVENMSAPTLTKSDAPASAACCTMLVVPNGAPKAGSCKTTPPPPPVTAVTHRSCPSSEVAMPFTVRPGRSATTRRTATSSPLWVMRTMVLSPRLST